MLQKEQQKLCSMMGDWKYGKFDGKYGKFDGVSEVHPRSSRGRRCAYLMALKLKRGGKNRVRCG
jgi:hypothetical protein